MTFIAIAIFDNDVPQQSWQEMYCPLDVLRVTNGTPIHIHVHIHIYNTSSVKNYYLWQFFDPVSSAIE